MKKHLSLKSITPFILKLHLYIGIFIAPFILLATLTGVLYILTTQIESYIYRDLQALAYGK
ncbi:PepSY domain-containing protein [Halobacteriovorax marinus]|uniref:PepSY domain-containing protein n=1 Tax=Halobacteriovorax marinus TaxID=97084 RepID=UPI003A93A56F